MAKSKAGEDVKKNAPEESQQNLESENVEPEDQVVEDPLEIEKKKTQEMKDLAQRVQADFENYRKRTQDATKKAKQEAEDDILTDLLGVLDSFDRALVQITDEGLLEGLNKIRKQFTNFFESKNVEEIKAEGEQFNPMIHNAIMTVEDKENEDKVVEVLQKGYKRGNHVLRAPLVKVAK